jgi:uncharacterized protein with PQ loop repeat
MVTLLVISLFTFVLFFFYPYYIHIHNCYFLKAPLCLFLLLYMLLKGISLRFWLTRITF